MWRQCKKENDKVKKTPAATLAGGASKRYELLRIVVAYECGWVGGFVGWLVGWLWMLCGATWTEWGRFARHNPYFLINNDIMPFGYPMYNRECVWIFPPHISTKWRKINITTTLQNTNTQTISRLLPREHAMGLVFLQSPSTVGNWSTGRLSVR